MDGLIDWSDVKAPVGLLLRMHRIASRPTQLNQLNPNPSIRRWLAFHDFRLFPEASTAISSPRYRVDAFPEGPD